MDRWRVDLNRLFTRESGLPHAIGAYLCWGFIPLYFSLLKTVAPGEILAQRIIWSVPVALLMLAIGGQWHDFTAALRNGRVIAVMLLSASLIAANWLIYIGAITAGHVLATSIGYYLNPLVNVLLGRLFLGERLNAMQKVAVAIAALGAGLLLLKSPGTLWISLSLAFSFGTYGLVRKLAPLGSLTGLGVEVTVLAVPALIASWLFIPQAGFGHPPGTQALLAAGGVVTAIPLLLFATAARRMSYTALGFAQYLAPSIVFLLGVFYYREPLDPAKLVCFLLIWSAIGIFSWDALKRSRR